jgi:hypothetical protein
MLERPPLEATFTSYLSCLRLLGALGERNHALAVDIALCLLKTSSIGGLLAISDRKAPGLIKLS